MRTALMLATMMMLAAGAYLDAGMPSPRISRPKPRGYGVHLSKAERRGKTPAELQALRAEKLNG